MNEIKKGQKIATLIARWKMHTTRKKARKSYKKNKENKTQANKRRKQAKINLVRTNLKQMMKYRISNKENKQ